MVNLVWVLGFVMMSDILAGPVGVESCCHSKSSSDSGHRDSVHC